MTIPAEKWDNRAYHWQRAREFYQAAENALASVDSERYRALAQFHITAASVSDTLMGVLNSGRGVLAASARERWENER